MENKVLSILELQWKDFIETKIKIGTFEIKTGEKQNDRQE